MILFPHIIVKENFEVVREMIPQGEIYVYEENEKIQGFIGIMDSYIAGIFIETELQSKGIGKILFDEVKNKKDSLALSVYKKNQRATQFYLREGFKVRREEVDENTKEKELFMEWKKVISH